MSYVKRKIIVLVIFNLMLLLSFLPSSRVEAPIQKDELKSCFSIDPVVDGQLSPGEWAAAIPISVMLYNILDQDDTITIRMMSVYSEELLYIAVTVPDNTVDGEDFLTIAFRTNPSVPFISYTAGTGDWTYGKDNDMKLIWVHNNHSIDCITSDAYPMYWGADIESGGVENSYAKCYHTGPEITFELRFPLDSGDAIGCDPALGVGDSIEIFTYYFEGGAGKSYSQVLENDADYEYNILTIGCQTTTTPPTISPVTSPITASTSVALFAIIAGIVGTSIVIGGIRRKRKNE